MKKNEMNETPLDRTIELRPLRRAARQAGLVYLAFAIVGGFGQFAARSGIPTDGGIGLVLQKFQSQEILVRIGLFADLAGQTLFFFLGLMLYRLFAAYDKPQSRILLGMIVVSIPLAFMACAAQLVMLQIAIDPNFLSQIDNSLRLSAFIMLHSLQTQIFIVVGIFWGLWLLPFGFLLIKSRFAPTPIGVALVLACLFYLIDTAVSIILPSASQISSLVLSIVAGLGEFSAILWLTIRGISDKAKLIGAIFKKEVQS